MALVMLVVLAIDGICRRYFSANAAKSSVRAFDHWLRSEVCLSSEATYVASPDPVAKNLAPTFDQAAEEGQRYLVDL